MALWLDVHLDVEFGIWADLDAFTGREIFLQDGGSVPVEVPAVFEGDDGVFAGKDGGQGEGAVGIALVAAGEDEVVLGDFRNEDDHDAVDGLAVFERDTGNAASAFGDDGS